MNSYWILFPISVVMVRSTPIVHSNYPPKAYPKQILTGILRHYATVLMNSPPKSASTLAESRERLALLRGVNLRNHGPAVLDRESFEMRKNYIISGFRNGAFLKDPSNRGGPPANPMTDPAGMEAMMGMMKGNMMMMIPQTLIMSWINAFFSGFVIRELLLGPLSLGQELTMTRSEIALPAYHPLQVDAAVWCHDSGP
jgi:hypothetical protein